METMKAFLDNNMVAIMLILLGLGFLLGGFGVFDFGALAGTWWPLILISLGVSGIIKDKFSIWSIGLLVIGGILQLQMLAIIEGSFWSVFWPVVLILVGLSFLQTKEKPENEDL